MGGCAPGIAGNYFHLPVVGGPVDVWNVQVRDFRGLHSIQRFDRYAALAPNSHTIPHTLTHSSG